jgi:hypothetical protein
VLLTAFLNKLQTNKFMGDENKTSVPEQQASSNTDTDTGQYGPMRATVAVSSIITGWDCRLPMKFALDMKQAKQIYNAPSRNQTLAKARRQLSR